MKYQTAKQSRQENIQIRYVHMRGDYRAICGPCRVLIQPDACPPSLFILLLPPAVFRNLACYAFRIVPPAQPPKWFASLTPRSIEQRAEIKPISLQMAKSHGQRSDCVQNPTKIKLANGSSIQNPCPFAVSSGELDSRRHSVTEFAHAQL